MTRLLLDTHVLVWWVHSPGRLSRPQRKALESVDDAGPAIVAGISLWEVAMLHERGRIRLSLPLRDWLEKATAPPRVRIQGLTPPIAAALAELAGSDLPRDPADRILVATARVLGAKLVTQDEALRRSEWVETL